MGIAAPESFEFPLLACLVFPVVPCDLTSVTNLRRIVDFSVCSTFYLLGWTGDFSSYMLDWKLEVLSIFQELIFASVDFFFFIVCLYSTLLFSLLIVIISFLQVVLLASLDGNLYHCFIFYSYHCF